ncbi:PAS domain-containing sensor histidine kinase, partial [Klebsiella oxytoca]
FYKVDTFKQGTGLGLSICKTIVEHLQGDISVESEMGRGSRFTVILPFERQAVN